MTGFQNTPGEIHWKMHFKSSPAAVYHALSTDEGRAGFWAESAREEEGVVEFRILNYAPAREQILKQIPDQHFSLGYFGTTVCFELGSDGESGCVLNLSVSDVPESDYWEMVAGWVSVLMSMKAQVDHGVDLRNHDPERSWQQGYADN